MDSRDFEKARQVLAVFDVIIIFEWLHRPEFEHWISSRLGIPSTLHFGWKRKGHDHIARNALQRKGRRATAAATTQLQWREEPPATVIPALREDNSLDIAFYRYAMSLVAKSISSKNSLLPD